jgi:hypothetical protein
MGSRIAFTTSHSGCADRLVNLIQDRWGCTPDVSHGRGLISLRMDLTAAEALVAADIARLQTLFAVPSVAQWPNCCRQAFLRALFLYCGSLSEPAAAYHMELAIRPPQAAEQIRLILLQFGLNSTFAHRSRHAILYLQEGQYLAEFLILAGAHQSLLTFESLRVEKEMRNSVNRVVNCDNANTRRVAYTAARQLERIRTLYGHRLEERLPADLRAAADLRLTHPDYSLKELGAALDPPLGKSGINHRLRRLELLVDTLLSEAVF